MSEVLGLSGWRVGSYDDEETSCASDRSQSGARPFVPALTFGEIDLVSLKGPVRA